MKRFNFRLEKILDLKKHIENRWELKLGEITGKCEQVKQEMRDLGIQKKNVFTLRLSKDLSHVTVTEQYLKHIEQKLGKLQSDLMRYEQERQEVQKKFIEASRERKVYDKLKDKRAREFHKQELRREYMELDDMNNNAAARNMGG